MKTIEEFRRENRNADLKPIDIYVEKLWDKYITPCQDKGESIDFETFKRVIKISMGDQRESDGWLVMKLDKSFDSLADKVFKNETNWDDLRRYL